MQGRRCHLNCAERGSNAADRGARTCAQHFKSSASPHDESPRVDERRIFSARLGNCVEDFSVRFNGFRDGRGLSGERRLVDHESVAVAQHAVGGDALAFADENDVAGHKILRGDAQFLPVANDARHRLRKIAQGLKRSF